MRTSCARILLWTTISLPACAADDRSEHETVASELAVIGVPPADALFAPADYDGDGLTDFAVKGGNVWYLDLAACSTMHAPESNCSNFIDDDLDGFVNDGCGAVGTAESGLQCSAPYSTAIDDDLDGYIDDGCVKNGCLGPDGFGGRWDLAFAGYGGNSAIPIPGDYGRAGGGPKDGKADLAIKDASGMFAIDYADNGFGAFDEAHWGYGGSNAVPWIGDFDGDGRTDLSVRTTDGLGNWYFDYSSNGFGGWDVPCTTGCPCTVTGGGGPVGGYGGALDMPAIGNFNGDLCDDLSVKTASGQWYFDLHGDGFGWQPPYPGCPVPLTGYGDTSAPPIVANYDPGYDNRADLAIHTANGSWAIDFAADGYGAWNTPFYGAGWSSSAAKLVPGRYTASTGNLDQGIKSAYGYWHLDRGHNGYGSWDGSYATPPMFDAKRAHIDGVRITQPPVALSDTFAETELAPNQLVVGVRYTLNVHLHPGTVCTAAVDDDGDGLVNDGCPPVGAGESACGDASDNDGDGFPNDGCPGNEFTPTAASVRVNADARTSPALNVEDVGGHTVQNSSEPIVYPHERRLGFTCTQPGRFRLAMMLSEIHTATALHADYGLDVTCAAAKPGLYGVVRNRRTGAVITAPMVKVDGVTQVVTAGAWHAAAATGGPHRVLVTAPGFAPVEVVNVSVPATGSPAGIQLDTALEPGVSLTTGVTYKTYLDYSRGRSILHAVEIDVTRAPITLGKAPLVDTNSDGAVDDFQPLLQIAASQNAPVLTNGIWWTLAQPRTNVVGVAGQQACAAEPGPLFPLTRPIGYMYVNGFVGPGVCTFGQCRPADMECASGKHYANPVANRPPTTTGPALLQAAWELPMFGVKGTGVSRRASIIATAADFMTPSATWKSVAGSPGCPVNNTCPIYDADNNNQSDFDQAFQMGQFLLRNGTVIARGILAEIGTAFPGEFAFARSAVGVNAAGTRVWLVTADGEGLDGGHGATPNQLGEFYKTILAAQNAMIIDSGESTELILRTTSGHRRVNMLSSENHAADGVAPDGNFVPSGRVFATIKAGT